MSSEKEIEKLRRRFGEFERATFEYKQISVGFGEWIKRLSKRRGEVVLIVPRGDGQVLLHTKPHYPEGIYRLPTGGIRPDEDAEDAARREGYEEIGFKPKKVRLLGVLDNVFRVKDTEYIYPSFVFLTREFTGNPKPTDPDELISGFREADRMGIRATALQLASLPGAWHEWGRFRAMPHLWLAEHWKGKKDS